MAMRKIKSRRVRAMTYAHVLGEVNQGHEIRMPFYQRLEKSPTLGKNKRVVAFFTSFRWPVIIDDHDGDILEELLQNAGMDNRELVLILNSAGGDALAAERIVNICRSFSPNGFTVIVPKMAKSAATMICFGAKEIWMSNTSELGPIDPQIPIQDDRGNVTRYQAAHEIIESYQDLLNKANRTSGNQEPYLQQLARFDARDIRRIISAQELSKSIAVKCLKSELLTKFTERQIIAKIKPFLDPKYSITHGRPLYHGVVQKAGLKVRRFEVRDSFWQDVWKLYVRLDWLVTSSGIAKLIESVHDQYHSHVPPFLLDEHHISSGENQ
jgi:ATP-dependent protease ClpP protease subunit